MRRIINGYREMPLLKAERLARNGYSNNPSGFTLLEMIIVLLLSLLILGVVSVSLAGLISSTRLLGAAREFQASLRQARDLAAIHGEEQEWRVDLESGVYGIEGRSQRKIPPRVGLIIVVSTGEEIRSGKYLLRFQPNRGSSGELFRLTDKNRMVTIALDPVIGAVIYREVHS
ncbi:MAG: prepilin-type N-terminal cleavage/methylation domain-containing protein [Thermodesulfobacteriota bacterium]